MSYTQRMPCERVAASTQRVCNCRWVNRKKQKRLWEREIIAARKFEFAAFRGFVAGKLAEESARSLKPVEDALHWAIHSCTKCRFQICIQIHIIVDVPFRFLSLLHTASCRADTPWSSVPTLACIWARVGLQQNAGYPAWHTLCARYAWWPCLQPAEHTLLCNFCRFRLEYLNEHVL